MAENDWYRGTEWDAATRALFEEKLARARSQRAQYLRIKGYELTRAEDSDTRESGRELLRRVLTEHPDEHMWVVAAHDDLGRSYAEEKRFEEAARHYKGSRKLYREGGGVDAGTPLALAEVIVEAGWESEYDSPWSSCRSSSIHAGACSQAIASAS